MTDFSQQEQQKNRLHIKERTLLQSQLQQINRNDILTNVASLQ